MYRCQVCGRLSEPRQPEFKHPIIEPIVRTLKRVVAVTPEGNVTEPVTLHKGTRIVRELTVCRRCHESLLEATPEQLMMAFKNRPQEKEKVAPVYRMGQPRPTRSATKPKLFYEVPSQQHTPKKKAKTKKQRRQIAASRSGSVNKVVTGGRPAPRPKNP